MTQKTGFAAQIRQALIRLSEDGDVPYSAIALELDMISDKEKQKLYRALRDFFKRGECTKVGPGVLRYGRTYDPHPAQKTRCMYRFIRSNKNNRITQDEIVANCGVSKETAAEYLAMLVNRDIVRRIEMPGSKANKYQMIKDPGPDLVRNDANAEKMRRWRETKKKALAELDKAGSVLVGATQAVAMMRKAMANINLEGDSDEA